MNDRELYIQRRKLEQPKFERVFAALPKDKLDYKPHERSPSAAQIMWTIAAEHAIFGQNGPRVGSPACGAIVSYLTRVIGAKRAREMWMLSRRYSAAQALDMGLVNVVVPMAKLDEEVDKWCRELLALSPTCLKILKASFVEEFSYLFGQGPCIGHDS